MQIWSPFWWEDTSLSGRLTALPKLELDGGVELPAGCVYNAKSRSATTPAAWKTLGSI